MVQKTATVKKNTDKTCIVIAGATATGKTDIAVHLARHFNTSIVSADSRQCFRELNIGVAKPPEQYLREIHHYFINSHNIQDQVTAADYGQYALDKLEKIFLENDVAIVTGGTGLYLKALMYGMDEIPAVHPHVRALILAQYEAQGMEWLEKALQTEDPVYAGSGEMKNPQRMMRALEVIRGTGRSIKSFQVNESKVRPFSFRAFQVVWAREILYSRINERVDAMVASGLEEEARSLLPFRHLNALQTVGYKEWFDHFSGKFSREEAIEAIKKNTRQYAKRQITWFNKFSEFEKVPADAGAILTACLLYTSPSPRD